jgi:hypothetical protein
VVEIERCGKVEFICKTGELQAFDRVYFIPQAHSKYHECGAPQPKWVQCAHGLWQAGDQGTWMEASHDGEDNSLMVVPSHCEVVISGVSGGAK